MIMFTKLVRIFTGKGMTCVLNPALAACRVTADERGTRRTPAVRICCR
jgi:hypothetical protein